ncbi:MAG TPA: acyltransferase [Gaiellaceae bacterium]|nr:acyltransferase [Gaiellaceae bacterium]
MSGSARVGERAGGRAVVADARPAADAAPKRSKLAPFVVGDAIRGAGLLLVVGYHSAFQSLWVIGDPPTANAGGWVLSDYGPRAGALIESAAVALPVFFVLSGYLLARPYVFAIVRDERMPRTWPYLRNRVLRIFPVLWVVFAGMLLIYGTKGSSPYQLLSVVTLLTVYKGHPFASYIGQAWSLQVEAVFYIVLPVVAIAVFAAARRLKLGSRARFQVVLWGCVAVAVLTILGRLTPWWIASFSGILLYFFMPGVILAAVEAVAADRIGAFGRRHPYVIRALTTGAVAVGAGCVLAVVVVDPTTPVTFALGLFVGAAAVPAASLVRQWSGIPIWRILNNRLLNWIGVRSYSFYLVHLALVVELAPRIARHVGFSLWPTAVLTFFGVLVSTAAIGSLVHVAVERPFLELKARRTAEGAPGRWWFPWGANSDPRPAPARPRTRLAPFVAGDAMRGAGVAAVIGAHCAFQAIWAVGLVPGRNAGGYSLDAYGPRAAALFESAELTVPMFFVLSAYLLSRPYVFAIVRDEAMPRTASYVRNRILRIIPVLWFVFAVLLLVYGTRGASGYQIFSVFTLLTGYTGHPFASYIGQAWSLRVEAIFYILLPFAAFAALRLVTRARLGVRGRIGVLGGGALVVGLALLTLAGLAGYKGGYLPMNLPDEHTSPAILLYFFTPGILLAVAESVWAPRAASFGARHPRTAGAITTWAALLALAATMVVVAIDPRHEIVSGAVIALAAAAVPGSALIRQWFGRPPWRPVCNRVFSWIGARSYTFYLVHLAIVIELAPRAARVADHRLWPTFLVLAAASIATTGAIGTIVHALVERPFLGLKVARGTTGSAVASPWLLGPWRRPVEPEVVEAPVATT